MICSRYLALSLLVVLVAQLAESEQNAPRTELNTGPVQRVDGADNLKAIEGLANSLSVRKRRDEIQAPVDQQEEAAPPQTTEKPKEPVTEMRKAKKAKSRKAKGKGSKRSSKKKGADLKKDTSDARKAPSEATETFAMRSTPVNPPVGLSGLEEMLANSPFAELIFGLDKKRDDLEHFVEAGKDLAGEVMEKLAKLPAITMRKVKNGIKEQIKAFEQKLDDEFGLAIPTTLFENGKKVTVAEAVVRSALGNDEESKRRAMDEDSVVFEGKVPPQKAIPPPAAKPKILAPKEEPLKAGLLYKPAYKLTYPRVSFKVKFIVLKLFVETLHALTGLVLENELLLADGSLLKLLGKIRPLLLALKKVESRAYL